jgi:hypothetical protein
MHDTIKSTASIIETTTNVGFIFLAFPVKIFIIRYETIPKAIPKIILFAIGIIIIVRNAGII